MHASNSRPAVCCLVPLSLALTLTLSLASLTQQCRGVAHACDGCHRAVLPLMLLEDVIRTQGWLLGLLNPARTMMMPHVHMLLLLLLMRLINKNVPLEVETPLLFLHPAGKHKW